MLRIHRGFRSERPTQPGYFSCELFGWYNGDIIPNRRYIWPTTKTIMVIVWRSLIKRVSFRYQFVGRDPRRAVLLRIAERAGSRKICLEDESLIVVRPGEGLLWKFCVHGDGGLKKKELLYFFSFMWMVIFNVQDKRSYGLKSAGHNLKNGNIF